MTPEERKKAFESLTPEQRQAMEERRKRREGGDAK
jgi:Spy/CpxP family protein refolding chaperone